MKWLSFPGTPALKNPEQWLSTTGQVAQPGAENPLLPFTILVNYPAQQRGYQIRIMEAYKSLLIDFESLTDEEIRSRRDSLTRAVSRINKTYPGTDDDSFREAQKNIKNYLFEDGEADKVLHLN